MLFDLKSFIKRNIQYKIKNYNSCVRYITEILLCFVFVIVSISQINCAYADNIVPAVPFFPERMTYLQTPKNQFHKAMNDYILKDCKSDSLQFLVGIPTNKADYQIIMNHAVGCPDLAQSEKCRLLVLWDLLRADNAPVASWQAYYPINIPLKYHSNHFQGFIIPEIIVQQVGDDFIKSLNYETLKNQDFDKVYIKPDKLSDGTTLCSHDTIRQFYAKAGLYVTDVAYKARFLINTKVIPITYHQNNVDIIAERLIIDRLTGQSKVFPIRLSIEKNFLENDSYDCNQSASITIQDIGLFIDKAP